MNREIFTMPSAQDVPIDTVDAEEIELQESMKGVRNLIREMLQEATLKIGDELHYMPDDMAKQILSGTDASATRKTTKARALDPSASAVLPKVRGSKAILASSTIAQSIGKFPPSLQQQAAIVYAEHRDEIDKFRTSPLPSSPGSSGPLPPAWGKKMLYVAENERAGAVGKGEVLTCVMWQSSSAGGGGEKGWDVKIGEAKHSVKFSQGGKPVFKLNGVFDDVKTSMKASLTASGLKGVKGFIAKTLDGGKTGVNSYSIAEAALESMGGDETAKSYVDAYFSAGDAAVRKLGAAGGYSYLFFSPDEYKFHASDDIAFVSLDAGQSKVAITGGKTPTAMLELRNAPDDAAVEAVAASSPGAAAEAAIATLSAYGTVADLAAALAAKPANDGLIKAYSIAVQGKQKMSKKAAIDSLAAKKTALPLGGDAPVRSLFESRRRHHPGRGPSGAGDRSLRECRFLLAELFPPRHPSLVTELALYSRHGIITEGAKEKATDAVQFLIGAAVEYGISVPTLGTGVPLGSAAETCIDAAFAAESIVAAIAAVEGITSGADKFKAIFNKALGAKSKINGDLPGFYADVVRLVQVGLNLLGEGALVKVRELADELKEVLEGMIDKVLDPIGKAIKFLVPDATAGALAAEAVKAILEALAENCFDTVAGALDKAGKFAKFITDPDKFPSFLEEAIPALVTFTQAGAKKLEDTSIIKAALMGGGAGIILKELGPTGLNKLASILTEKKPDIVELARKVTGVLIPIVFTLLALMQVMLKDEYTLPDSEKKSAEAGAAAGSGAPSESRQRDARPILRETRALLHGLGIPLSNAARDRVPSATPTAQPGA